MNIVQVNDNSANLSEMIVHWASCLGRSVNRHKVFDQINSGKRAVWSVAEIAQLQNLSTKTVLVEGKKLARGELVLQEHGFPVKYKKRELVQAHKRKIKEAALKKKQRDKIVTVRNPKIKVTSVLQTAKRKGRARFISPDKIEQFSKMKQISASKVEQNWNLLPISEEAFKLSIIKIIGEPYDLKDWGGEQLDIFSTRPRIKAARKPTGFALKGPGSAKGTLTPGKMGKNGDQIQRLIDDGVEVAIVQYEGQIGQSIHTTLARLGGYKASQTETDFFYSVIDKEDGLRLRLAYPKEFDLGTRQANKAMFARAKRKRPKTK